MNHIMTVPDTHLRENAGLFDTVTTTLDAAIGGALPIIQREVQLLAETQAVNVVNMISGAIPSESELIKIGNSIASMIESTLNEYVLPEIFNRAVNNKLSGVVFTDSQLNSLYQSAISKIPSTATIHILQKYPLTINIQNIIRKALPPQKFNELVNRIDPLILTIEQKAVPIVTEKLKDVTGLVMFSGFLAGSVITFGLVKLYYSIGN